MPINNNISSTFLCNFVRGGHVNIGVGELQSRMGRPTFCREFRCGNFSDVL